MTIKIGGYEFDHVTYDDRGDVLYLHIGRPQPAARTYGTPEGHAVRYDEADRLIGITIVNAKWLIDQEGVVRITIHEPVEAPAGDLAPAFSPT